MKDELVYVRILMRDKTDGEVEQRLKRLEAIGKGRGFSMFDHLTKLLEERRAKT